MIYILHIDPPFKHARHYVGWTKDIDVTRRVGEHLRQAGRRPSRLVGVALAAGCSVTLAGVLEGDRDFERQLKARGGAMKFCPACRVEYNARAAATARARRARKKIMKKTEFVLLKRGDEYLTDDFKTWSPDSEKAHLFIPGAALNQCVEEWRGRGGHVVEAPAHAVEAP